MSEVESPLNTLRVIGIDPGPIPGLVELKYADWILYQVSVLQCSKSLFSHLLDAVLAESAWRTLIAVEEFVVGPRAGRSGTAHAGGDTRQVLAEVKYQAERARVPCLVRNASAVKLWATDERLEAAGLIEACKGMRHARDAGRHALFAAVRDGGIPDPLSRKAHA